MKRSCLRCLRGIVCVLLALSAPVQCCVIGLAYIFIGHFFPSSELLAQLYFAAVQSGDSRWVGNLALFDGTCRRVVEEDARRDIAQFGFSDIRGVTIRIEPSGAGSAEVQYALILLEYRRPDQSEWQSGTIHLVSSRTLLGAGFRYLCGNIRYHPP